MMSTFLLRLGDENQGENQGRYHGFNGQPTLRAGDHLNGQDHDDITNLKVWSTDLHAGPIGCQIHMFEDLGVHVAAKIQFPNCMFFHTKEGKDLCATSTGLRVLSNNNWMGFSLDPDPVGLRKKFYEEYLHDAEFASTDIVICSHPAANCELYLPFNKSIIIYNTQRIEMGRGDNYIWWRQPLLGDNYHVRWKHWALNLQSIAAQGHNLIAANNQYDVHHIEYLTGVKVTYIPSWCGESPEGLHQQAYQPSRGEIVLTPYRTNLEFSKNSIPESGWPDHHAPRSFSDPLQHSLFDELRALMKTNSDLQVISMGGAFSGKHFESIKDFNNFKGALVVPYQASTMFFFQLYRASVPIFAPSPTLLRTWVGEHRILWEVSYGNPQRLVEGILEDMPNPNHFDEASRSAWFTFYDVYQYDTFPHIIYFDSWSHLLKLVRGSDLSSVSARMRAHNVREYSRIKTMWAVHLGRLSRARSRLFSAAREQADSLDDALAQNNYPSMKNATR